MFDIRRREFITLLGAAVSWPLAARSEQKLPTVGYLGSSTASAQSQWVAAFVQRLLQLGWIDSRTIALEYRWAEGRSERFAEIAAEFALHKVNVIVTSGTAPTLAAKRVTSDVPIIFAVASDPIGNGLVASLARPGGNVTGLSIQQTDLAAKKLALLRELVPGFRRLAVMANIGSPAGVLRWARSRQLPAHSGSRPRRLELGNPKTSRPPSRRLRAERMPFISAATRS